MYTSVEFHNGNMISFYNNDNDDMDDVLIEIPKEYEFVLKEEEPEYDGSRIYVLKKKEDRIKKKILKDVLNGIKHGDKLWVISKPSWDKDPFIKPYKVHVDSVMVSDTNESFYNYMNCHYVDVPDGYGTERVSYELGYLGLGIFFTEEEAQNLADKLNNTKDEV